MRMRMRMLCGVGAGALLVVGAGSPVVALAPEADLAYHGYVSMAAGSVDVRLTPQNHGPNAVADATVRLRWSAALADVQRLPEGCARVEARAVVCRTGALAADGLGEEIRLTVWLRGVPSEVTMEVDTVWSGGAVDRNHANDRQRVLALDTGDSYAF
ncbi:MULTISPECIES: hypothetical protein [unclassified Streptomyces]|uniref:hypothetical protein n=1 Tax=unclassified Streptomyces TaxID=2593676 RepID=UPI002E812B8C|nr:hypothetical protein [Streptomyces sp. NBC_00589]WTI42629.1 hypothetical protein OIC96_20315 [Streptomyces sp. NBC_00775]WUB33151.1 hypothetical protein OHA51_29420 [Streptomyces sp. NBC_00589]